VGTGYTLEASKVAAGSIHLTLQNILSTVIGVLGLAFLARTITQEEMGTLSAIILLSSFIQLASSFGLPQSLAKFVSELGGRGEDISTHFISTLIFEIPVALLLCLVLFLFPREVSLTLFGTASNYELIKLAAVGSLFFALAPPFNRLLLGSGHLKRIAVCGISSTAARWLSIVFLIQYGYGFYGAVVGWIIGDIALLVSKMISSIGIITFRDDLLNRSANLIPSLLKFSYPLFMASIVTFLYTWYDRALILAFLPLADLGVYNMSYKAFSVLTSMATALGQSLFPYYGMAYGRKDHKAIAAGIKRASRYTMIIIFPLTLGLLSTAKPVITLFAGQQYEPGWSILAILSIFGLAYGVLPVFQGLLLIYEKTKTVFLLSFIPVISSLGLLPLLWILGLNGLAIVRGVSLLLTFLLTIYSLSKIVKIKFDKQTYTKVLIASAIMAVAVLAVQQYYYNRFLLPAYGLVGAIVYLAGIRLLRVLNNADILLMKQILGERTSKYIIRILAPNRKV
jgi:O-antigen/teichoic acid export membrane protein